MHGQASLPSPSRFVLFERWAIRAVFLIAAGTLLHASGPNRTWWLPGTAIALPRWLMLGIAIAELLIGWVASTRWPRAALALAVPACLTSALLPAVGRPIERVRIASSKAIPEREYFTDVNSIPDNRYGFRGMPNVVTRDRDFNYDVRYTFDSEGWRSPPGMASRVGLPEIWMLGCSFTFGSAVADDEAYPSVLANEVWTNYCVRNLAISGWGTAHASLLLADRLRACRQDELPVLVTYGWIDDHTYRNYRRRSWHAAGGNTARFPLYELLDGDAVFQGLVPASEAYLPDEASTGEAEARVSIAILKQMHEFCSLNGVAFLVLYLQQFDHRQIIATLQRETEVPVLDLSRLGEDVFEYNRHPSVSGHRAFAAAIAESTLPAQLSKRDDLHRPGAVRWKWPNRVGWHVENREPRSGNLKAEWVGGAKSTVRLTQTTLRHDLDDSRWRRRWLPTTANRSCELLFKARADLPRTICVRWTDSQGGRPIWFNERIALGTEWREYRFRPEAASLYDEPNTTLTFALGGSTAAVELAEVHVVDLDSGNEIVPDCPGLLRP